MDSQLAPEAIAAALSGNWTDAVKINKQILKNDSRDCEALNRLAKAFFELGKTNQAKATCQKVLRIDQFNSISQRNLEKWKQVRSQNKTPQAKTSPCDFIEESGKTKLISLLNLGDTKIIAKLNCGNEAFLSPRAHRVSIITSNKKYIGRLPDDLAARLKRFIKAGNTYRVLLKSVDSRSIKVFIIETFRAKQLQDTPSFPPEKATRLEVSDKFIPEN